MFLFSLFQSTDNYALIISITVSGAIIVFVVIVVAVMIIHKFLARRRNYYLDKLGEKRSSNPNREKFSFANNLCYVSEDTTGAME